MARVMRKELSICKECGAIHKQSLTADSKKASIACEACGSSKQVPVKSVAGQELCSMFQVFTADNPYLDRSRDSLA